MRIAPPLRRALLAIAAHVVLVPGLAHAAADPAGDTFGSLAVQHDLVELAVETEGSELVVEAVFAAAVYPADSGAANALAGTIDIDTDRNPTTGAPGAVDAFSPNDSGLGVNHFLDLGGYSAATGDAPVLDALAGTVTGRAPVRFGARSVTVFIPLALLGGDDGAADVAAVFGTVSEPTDAAPGSGALTSDDGVVRLAGKRFKVAVSWADGAQRQGRGHVVPGHAADSTNFWFFGPANWELLVKVVDACAVNGHYWVFLAAATDVQYELTVTDTVTGAQYRVLNPLGRLSPAVAATDALAVCGS